MSVTNIQRVLNFLRNNHDAYCDDCLLELCQISPRQQVNQICRLKIAGQIVRHKGRCHKCGHEKLVNIARE